MAKLYPELSKKVTMSVYDVSKRILSSFDENLGSYAMERFKRKGIQLQLGMSVKEVKSNELMLNNGDKVGFGLLVWSTGLSPTDLVKSVAVPAKDSTQKLMTDAYLRVLDSEGRPIDGVFALGDCATIVDYTLPATAQVAKQKAIYLARAINKHTKQPSADLDKIVQPFRYSDMGAMAYVGGWTAVVDLKGMKDEGKFSGPAAWLFWRSAYFTMSVSLKNKVLIPMFWFLTWIFGRDISRIQ